jgi:hypothetical protein
LPGSFRGQALPSLDPNLDPMTNRDGAPIALTPERIRISGCAPLGPYSLRGAIRPDRFGA